jgi:two-component system sensor histidine kinase UhpB
MPLFYKILLTNSAIVAMGAVGGTIITVWHVVSFPHDFHYELIAFFAAAGLSISFAVNYFVLKLALDPLDRLQQGVDEVQAGHMDVRVTPGPLSDERFDRLISTFNQTLDRVEEHEKQLRQLPRAILQAQEEERQRVARELHDETAQALTSLLVRLRLFERSESPEAARKEVQELRKLTAGALEEVRRIALELRPTILDDLGIEAALAWKVDELNAGHPILTRLSVHGVAGRLPGELELVLYRVAQEALTNVARHSHARHVEVTLTQEEESICIEVSDDGVGFDPDVVTAKAGSPHSPEGTMCLGLLGMRERMALVGGKLLVISRPGEGTRLIARAPLGANSRSQLPGANLEAASHELSAASSL